MYQEKLELNEKNSPDMKHLIGNHTFKLQHIICSVALKDSEPITLCMHIRILFSVANNHDLRGGLQ